MSANMYYFDKSAWGYLFGLIPDKMERSSAEIRYHNGSFNVHSGLTHEHRSIEAAHQTNIEPVITSWCSGKDMVVRIIEWGGNGMVFNYKTEIFSGYEYDQRNWETDYGVINPSFEIYSGIVGERVYHAETTKHSQVVTGVHSEVVSQSFEFHTEETHHVFKSHSEVYSGQVDTYYDLYKDEQWLNYNYGRSVHSGDVS